MDTPVLIEERRDAVAVLTLNRPERMNALNGELMDALLEATRRLAGDVRWMRLRQNVVSAPVPVIWETGHNPRAPGRIGANRTAHKEFDEVYRKNIAKLRHRSPGN